MLSRIMCNCPKWSYRCYYELYLANVSDTIGKKKKKKKQFMATNTHCGSRLLCGEYAVRLTGVWESCPGVLHKSELSFFQEFRWIIVLLNYSFLIKPDPLTGEWEISNLSTQPPQRHCYFSVEDKRSGYDRSRRLKLAFVGVTRWCEFYNSL